MAGETLLGIARATGLSLATVRKYARAESFPARTAYGPGASMLDPYLAHLQRRLAEGCENAQALWREIREQGYPGGARQVHRWLAERRTMPAKTGPHVRRARPASVSAQPSPKSDRTPALPTVAQLAWHLTQPAAARSEAGAAALARIGQDTEARVVTDLAQRFAALVRACGVAGRQNGQSPANPDADLSAWLADARSCRVPAMETFAAGLETDKAASLAAFTEPWSSGQAEGQITKLKLFKRQSYGRASLDLLRRRVLLAA